VWESGLLNHYIPYQLIDKSRSILSFEHLWHNDLQRPQLWLPLKVII